MQAQDLVAEQVRARCQARGDGDVPLGTARAEEVRRPGHGGGGVVRELSDLDPDGPRVSLEGGTVVVGASGDVVEDGAAVGTVPLVPDEAYRLAGVNVDGSCGWVVATVVATDGVGQPSSYNQPV